MGNSDKAEEKSMSLRTGTLLVVICANMCASTAFADVKMPEVFTNNMVLQRELPVPVWGTAAPGEKVSVAFAGQILSTVAGDDGKWMVKLVPMETSNTNRVMTIQGSNTIRLSNVLVGEVWFCSGQSNMAGKFTKAKGRALPPEAFEKDLTRFRFCPWNGGWRALDANTQNFISMVAYYFGIELYNELDIPIGLVIRSTSGTPIQAWMSKEVTEAIRKRLDIPEDWGDGGENHLPGAQYAKGIDPIAPFAIRGVIWYQGERNAKTGTGWEYRYLLPHMIESWRELWATRSDTPLRNFPFYSVQVPVQAAEGEWPWLRDAFRRSVKAVENSGIAVFYDYGPALHPPNKEPCGKRLALWALAKDYGRNDLVHCGPLLDEVKIKGEKAILTFTHVGGGLKSASGGTELRFFEIAGKDGKYVAADAWIDGETVVVQSKQIAKPVYVRYLFRKPEPDPEVSLLNAEGLPASPFLTDDFKPVRIAPEVMKKTPSNAKTPMTDEERKERRRKKREARKKKASE